MDIKAQIRQRIDQILSEMESDTVSFSVETPANLLHGDYSTNVALVLSKKLRRSPMEIAEEIKEKLQVISYKVQGIEKIEIMNPGFINFSLSHAHFITEVKQLLVDGTAQKANTVGKKVIVEYSSPNIAKPFTIGHLRSTVIGDAVANLLEAVGYEVYRDNHIGDWGTQFGKQIYAIKAWGNEDEIDKAEQPVKLLVALYVRFHEEAEKDPSLDDAARAWFKKLETGDTEARRLWQKCIDWSWKEFESIYQKLGVPSSKKSFENNGRGYSEAYFEDKMTPAIKALEEKGLLKEGKEGAKIVEFAEATKLPPLMILKKDGASLYATRDLATDMFRLQKYGKDVVIINEVGAEQSLYWQQLFTLEQTLGWFTKEQRVHIKHGMYRFKEGKMSTRKGNVIWLEDVLAEAHERALKLGTQNNELRTDEKTAHMIGIGAIKWNDLKRNSVQDINFDWDDVLSMQGNSGPYMQYTAVRCQSVLVKSGVAVNDLLNEDFDTDRKLTSEEQLVLRLLARYEEVLNDAAENYAPHILATYLFELAQAFNNFYQKQQILKEEDPIKTFRLFVTHGTGSVITKGLQVLGIAVPERM